MSTPLGIVAGRGPLPLQIAQAQRGQGRDVFIVGLENEASDAIAAFDHAWAGIGQLKHVADTLHAAGCRDMVIIGHIDRPNLQDVMFDEGGEWFLQQVAQQGGAGDDQLLQAIVAYFQTRDLTVLGADTLLRDLLAPAGLQSQQGTHGHEADVARAVEVARAIGALDIGQGAVVCRKLVLAVEGPEGTDNMLARLATLPAAFLGTPTARAGVFAKLPKPQQDRRVDLPTIGVETISRAAAAGLAGVVYEAGGALFVEADKIRAEADAHGLFLIGIEPDGADS